MDKKIRLKKMLLVSILFMLVSVFPSKLYAEMNDTEGIHLTFEESEEGFSSRGGEEVVERTNEDAKEGEYSLKVTSREEAWHGPSLHIEDTIALSTDYQFSIWVKLLDDTSTELRLSTQIGEGDSASYQIIGAETADSDEWVQIEGIYRYDALVDNHVSIYVESATDETVSYLVDDLKITKSRSSSSSEVDVNSESIKDVYADYFLIGNAISMSELSGPRLDLLKKHHNLVTAENAMKPEYAYNSQREFDFSDQTRFVEKVQEEGLLLHGHVLLWHQQSPEWLHTKDGELLSREEALANLERHIEEVILHYGDSVIAWEVANEAMNDNPPLPEMWRSMLRRSEWYEAIGDDYLDLAFLKAREVLDENGWHDIKLYYNDYNDDNQNKSRAISHMVKELNENYAKDNPGELLVDGVGMQGHYNLGTNIDNVRQSLERLIDLGVEVGVTELDIMTSSTSDLSEAEELAQAILYAELFSLYKEHAEHISRVTFWGLDDSTSWRSEMSPLIFDRNLQGKLAYDAVIDPEGFLAEHQVEEGDTEIRKGSMAYGTPDFTNEDDSVWERGELIELDRYQMAWQGATGVGRVLWDEDSIYVRVDVEDSTINTSAEEEWAQDSIEVFIRESSGEESAYGDGDGQYRVNADGKESFGEMTVNNEVDSHVIETESGYTVMVAIPWQELSPEEGKTIGFDLQVNDATTGSRDSVAIWNDLSGQGYQDVTVFGELMLEKVDEGVAETEEDKEEVISEGNPVNLVLIVGSILLLVGVVIAYVIYSKKKK